MTEEHRGRPLSSDVISDYVSQQDQREHRIYAVSACSQSSYVECACGEKLYGANEREAREKHRTHRTR